jgi:hypothetical protein
MVVVLTMVFLAIVVNLLPVVMDLAIIVVNLAMVLMNLPSVLVDLLLRRFRAGLITALPVLLLNRALWVDLRAIAIDLRLISLYLGAVTMNLGAILVDLLLVWRDSARRRFGLLRSGLCEGKARHKNKDR